VARPVLGIRVERAHVQQSPDAVLAAGQRDLVGKGDMRGTEVVLAGFVEDGDQVDDGVASLDYFSQHLGIVNVRINDLDRG
jgi:hypothetical protein